jgi:hypothetical protein
LVSKAERPNKETVSPSAGHCVKISWKGKFWKYLLKMSVKAVLTKSSMRGFTMGRKGLQLILMIESRTFSATSTKATIIYTQQGNLVCS